MRTLFKNIYVLLVIGGCLLLVITAWAQSPPATLAAPDIAATITPTPEPLPPCQPLEDLPEPGALAGQVVDAETGEPVAGALVILGKDVTMSAADGTFEYSEIASGPQVLVATKDGYETASTEVFMVQAGKLTEMTLEMFPAGAFSHPQDPMASNQVDPKGAPTETDALRLAKLQGLITPVDQVEQRRLVGDYLVNYKVDDEIYAARAKLDHDAWVLTSQGQEWYIIQVCGNMAVPVPKYSMAALVPFGPPVEAAEAKDPLAEQNAAVRDTLVLPEKTTPTPEASTTPAAPPMAAPTIYFFYGDWCGYSRQAAAVVEAVKAKYGNWIKFVRVDVDRNFRYDSPFKISSVPTFIWTDAQGRVVNHVSGTRQAAYFDTIYWALVKSQGNAGPCTTPGLQITWPPADSTIAGRVNVYGTIAIPNFQFYKLEYWAANSGGWTWLLEKREPVENNEIFMLDTGTVPEGRYGLRITAVEQSGNYPEPCEIWWEIDN